MSYALLAIVSVAAIVVAGMSAVHGTTIVTGPATMSTAASVGGLSLTTWILLFAAISFCGWWLLRRRIP
jgi:hypothetical protein